MNDNPSLRGLGTLDESDVIRQKRNLVVVTKTATRGLALFDPGASNEAAIVSAKQAEISAWAPPPADREIALLIPTPETPKIGFMAQAIP